MILLLKTWERSPRNISVRRWHAFLFVEHQKSGERKYVFFATPYRVASGTQNTTNIYLPSRITLLTISNTRPRSWRAKPTVLLLFICYRSPRYDSYLHVSVRCKSGPDRFRPVPGVNLVLHVLQHRLVKRETHRALPPGVPPPVFVIRYINASY